MRAFGNYLWENIVCNPKMILILVFCLIMQSCNAQDISKQKIRVMTFNIRVNVPSDSLNAWPHRKDIVASMIRFHHADIAGVQEALSDQIGDLAGRLTDYNWFGVGRDDGLSAGEFMAVFYLKERFNVLDSGTFWLSENPQRPGLGWDAACNRIVTWGKLEDNNSGAIFYIFNTHFDHRGEIARVESARLLQKYIKDIAGKSDVIVTGDLNAIPTSLPYRILTQRSDGDSAVILHDAKKVSVNPHHGPAATFTGFKFSSIMNEGQPIDYIFVSDGITVISHAALSDTFDGRFPSDHMPVLAEILVKQAR